jgi:hypothetical protein
MVEGILDGRHQKGAEIRRVVKLIFSDATAALISNPKIRISRHFNFTTSFIQRLNVAWFDEKWSVWRHWITCWVVSIL